MTKTKPAVKVTRRKEVANKENFVFKDKIFFLVFLTFFTSTFYDRKKDYGLSRGGCWRGASWNLDIKNLSFYFQDRVLGRFFYWLHKSLFL